MKIVLRVLKQSVKSSDSEEGPNSNSNSGMEMDYGEDKEQGPTLEDEIKMTGID